MDEPRDRWWQLRLRNVLAAFSLFGLALAVGGSWQATPDFFHYVLIWFATWLLAGATLGMLFGHPGIGAFVGLAGAFMYLGVFVWLFDG